MNIRRVTVKELADRLEAALKREVDKLNSAIQATVGRSDAEIDRLRREIAEMRQAGDVAKLREAMKRIVAASIVAKNANAPEWILQRMADIFAVATTALAAPPRNCDVGSAKEQYRRFCLCCIKHKMPCRRSCTGCAECYANWAQMPYEEGGAR